VLQDLMTGGASIADTLSLWVASLWGTKQRIRALFTQDRVAVSAGQCLDALLGNEPRKTGWMRAEAAGDIGPWRQQALLGRGRWDAMHYATSSGIMSSSISAMTKRSW
jgi:hypothetical protein